MITSAWEESLNLYKGMGEPLDCGYYHPELTVQVMRLLEWILDSYIRKMVTIDEMQFGFVLCRGTNYAIFIVRHPQEKYITANKLLYLPYVHLEKALNHLVQKLLWRALRSLGVGQWAVCVIQGMYSDARSRMQVTGQYSKKFGVGVSVPQGCVLSPLLFLREFCTGVT